MARVSRKNRKTTSSKNVLAVSEEVYTTGVYIRLSQEELSNRGTHKLDNQEQVIEDYIKGKPEFIVYKIYCDNGCTGTNFLRNGFEELLNDVKEQKINCIIVKDLSRLGRNHIEVEQYLQIIFPFLKVRFIAVNDNFDSLHTSGDITASLKNIINAAYAKDISRKVYSSKQALREKGLFTGNIPSYGYLKSKKDPHKLVIDQETGNVVKEIFRLKLKNKTNTDIAKILNQKGVLSPKAYLFQKGLIHEEKHANGIWAAPTIKNILRNQMYTGDMVQGKKKQYLADGIVRQKRIGEDDFIVVKNTHDPLIDRETFAKVQNICNIQLESNRQKRYRNDGLIVTESILDHMIYSIDGQKMYRIRNVYKNQRVTYSYITAKTRKSDGSYFAKFYISEVNVFKPLKQAIYRYIEMLFSLEQYLNSRKIQERDRKGKKITGQEITRLKKEAENCSGYIAGLYKDVVQGIINFSEYEDLKLGYQEKKESARSQLALLIKDSEVITSHNDNKKNYKNQYHVFLNNNELTKELVQALVDKVIVLGKGQIEVKFLFADEIQAILSNDKGDEAG